MSRNIFESYSLENINAWHGRVHIRLHHEPRDPDGIGRSTVSDLCSGVTSNIQMRNERQCGNEKKGLAQPKNIDTRVNLM